MPLDDQQGRDDIRNTATFYDAAAARYDAEVDSSTVNASLRAAFRDRVAHFAGAANTILDFGCGTGADAAWYAAHGHRVVAYDISPGMIDVLRSRCGAEISSGMITPIAGDAGALISAMERITPVRAIAANFAVLNHIRDLRPVLATLASCLIRDGVIVANVLNPYYQRDMRQAWWWRGLPASIRTGAIKFEGAVTTYRHYPRAVSSVLPPSLAMVACGAAEGTETMRVNQRGAWRERFAGNYLTIVLRKIS
jgi:SAM-dependent methyltransferase